MNDHLDLYTRSARYVTSATNPTATMAKAAAGGGAPHAARSVTYGYNVETR